MTQEVLKMALDFVENGYLSDWRGITERQLEVITAIKEALAKEKALQALHSENERLGLYKDAYAQPEQEPMTEYLSKAYRLANELRCHLATAPAPQRTWVGLTLDQIALLHANYPNPQGFALALQAKLKERNT